MASRFTFTEKQFNEIKGLMAPGPKHKTYREIGEKYDLGTSTLNRIHRAANFYEYRRTQLVRSHNRRLMRQHKESVKRSGVVILAVVAAVELAVIVTLLVRG